jgi:heat shock protein HslJ
VPDTEGKQPLWTQVQDAGLTALAGAILLDDPMRTLFTVLLLGFVLTACSGVNSLSGNEPLTERYWRVLEIDAQPVNVGNNKAEPHIVLTAERKAHGSDGCNRFTGAYDNTAGLRFGRLASTMMACPQPVMEQARKFMQAAEATVDFRIQGKTLELLDSGGRVRMRLEAVALK